MIPREANLLEAPANCHLVKPKNPPKDIGYWISLAQDRLSSSLYFNSSLLRSEQTRPSKEREDSIFVPIFLFFLEKGGLKLHVTGNRYEGSRV